MFNHGLIRLKRFVSHVGDMAGQVRAGVPMAMGAAGGRERGRKGKKEATAGALGFRQSSMTSLGALAKP